MVPVKFYQGTCSEIPMPDTRYRILALFSNTSLKYRITYNRSSKLIKLLYPVSGISCPAFFNIFLVKQNKSIFLCKRLHQIEPYSNHC